MESCRGNGCCPSDPYSHVTIQGPTAVPSAQRAIPARRGPLVPEASVEKKANRAFVGAQGPKGEKGDTGETPVVTVA